MAETQINYSNSELPTNDMNLLQRVKGVIFSPGRTMESLVEKPKLLLPLIIIAVAQLALYLARFPLYQDYLRNTFIKSQSFMEGLTGTALTAEVIDNYMSKSLVQTVIAIPLTTLFGWFLSTVIFFAIFKIFGAKGKFKQYMSITAHAYIISVLYMVIVLAASFFTGSLHVDLPLTSIANLLPAEMSGSFLYGIALSMDIFYIWNYCVIAIGIAAVSGFKKRNSYILFAVIFAVGLLISSFGVIAAKSVTGG
jgi:hypothetical protein